MIVQGLSDIHHNSPYFEVDGVSLLTCLEGIQRDIRCLSKISIVFATFDPTDLQPPGQWNHWILGIEMLSQFASVEKLKIDLYFGGFYYLEDSWGERSHSGEELAQACERILQPLSLLQTLGWLRIHISWPRGRLNVGSRRKLEKRLERHVMGEGYNGEAARKHSTLLDLEDGDIY